MSKQPTNPVGETRITDPQNLLQGVSKSTPEYLHADSEKIQQEAANSELDSDVTNKIAQQITISSEFDNPVAVENCSSDVSNLNNINVEGSTLGSSPEGRISYISPNELTLEGKPEVSTIQKGKLTRSTLKVPRRSCSQICRIIIYSFFGLVALVSLIFLFTGSGMLATGSNEILVNCSIQENTYSISPVRSLCEEANDLYKFGVALLICLSILVVGVSGILLFEHFVEGKSVSSSVYGFLILDVFIIVVFLFIDEFSYEMVRENNTTVMTGRNLLFPFVYFTLVVIVIYLFKFVTSFCCSCSSGSLDFSDDRAPVDHEITVTPTSSGDTYSFRGHPFEFGDRIYKVWYTDFPNDYWYEIHSGSKYNPTVTRID